jgi:hypothetical protein
MKHQVQLVGALLYKDFRLFGLFASLTAALIVVLQFVPLLRLQGTVLGNLLVSAGTLSTVLLILVVFHEDATASVEHDWLTRPVPGLVLLLAKCAFVVLAILATAVLGAIASNLYLGRSLSESVLAGVASGAGGAALTFGLAVMALAAVTANVRQATIAFLAGIVTLTVVVVTTIRRFPPDEALFSGSQWVTARTAEIMVGLLAVSVLWIQYRVRHTLAARVMIGLGVAAIFAFVASMTWSGIFAVQRFFSADPAAAASIGLELAKGCFPAHVFDANQVPGVASFGSGPAEEQRGRAGPDIVFSTRSIPTGIPTGYRLTAGRVQLTYRAAGEVVEALHPPTQLAPPQMPADGGSLAAKQAWLLPRSTYDRLAKRREVETEIDYFLSLLAPKASAEFLADGRRVFYPGLGYCGATFSPADGVVNVDCFKWGIQPAQVVASLVDTPGAAGSPSGTPDFAPAALDFWGGQRHLMSLRATGSGIPRVKVTAFAALTHFERRIVVPDVLGGPISSCPAP